MQKHAYLTLLVLLISTPAYCRLGDSLKEAAERYGDPLAPPRNQSSYSLYDYKSGDVRVTLFFRNGITTGASYKKDNMSGTFVGLLLQHNANNYKWEQDQKNEALWHRSDGNVIAVLIKEQSKLLFVDKELNQAINNLMESDEGKQPYTPSKMEWLLLSLNTAGPKSDIEKEGFGINYMPDISLDPNTVMIMVSHTGKADPASMRTYIDMAEMSVRQFAGLKGWKWIKVRTEIVDLDAVKAVGKMQR